MSRRSLLSIDGRAALHEMFTDVLPNELRNACRAATYAIATEARDELKSRIKKDTGAGAESIFAERKRGSQDEHVSEVRGGRGAPYLLMLEFGTSRTRAQPFIVPGTEAMRPTLPDRYRELVAEKLEKAARRKRNR